MIRVEMRKLNKYDLDYTCSLPFFKESLEKTTEARHSTS
jgi:hypothetical protein